MIRKNALYTRIFNIAFDSILYTKEDGCVALDYDSIIQSSEMTELEVPNLHNDKLK